MSQLKTRVTARQKLRHPVKWLHMRPRFKHLAWVLERDSAYWNPHTLRLEYPPAFVETMPCKSIAPGKLFELMQQWDYNPTHDYAYQGKTILTHIKLYDNEVGYDSFYRYIMERN